MSIPARESAGAWYERQEALLVASLEKLAPHEVPLVEAVMRVSLHHQANFKIDLNNLSDQITDMRHSLHTIDRGLGVADQIEGMALEQAEALAARLGPPVPHEATVMDQLAALRADGHRRDWFIFGVGLIALVDLVLVLLNVEFGPASMGHNLYSLWQGVQP